MKYMSNATAPTGVTDHIHWIDLRIVSPFPCFLWFFFVIDKLYFSSNMKLDCAKLWPTWQCLCCSQHPWRPLHPCPFQSSPLGWRQSPVNPVRKRDTHTRAVRVTALETLLISLLSCPSVEILLTLHANVKMTGKIRKRRERLKVQGFVFTLLIHFHT